MIMLIAVEAIAQQQYRNIGEVVPDRRERAARGALPVADAVSG
jgi:hypothetical protein